MKTLITRPEDRKLPLLGAEHVIDYGQNSYRIYCTFAFHSWFERAYNMVLFSNKKDQWLSIRGLLDRSLARKIDMPLTELKLVMKAIITEWFLKPVEDINPTKTQIELLNYHFACIFGILLGGADAGKKFLSILGQVRVERHIRGL